MYTLTQRLARRLGMPELAAEENRGVVRAGIFLACVAMLLRAFFWAFTHRYWEDALITCLHAENFAAGFGLTHVRPGEPPLHGFTSPLSVLVPLIGDLLHVGFGIEFLKLVSIPASALMVFYILAIGLHREVRMPAPLILMCAAYAAVEHHQILFGMAGMETQLSALILILSVYYTIALRPVALGISLGLCMLVRPDYAFWTVIAGGYVLVRAPRALPKVVGCAVAVYAPWVLFTLIHYGSLIPNTVVAKGLGYTHWWERLDVVNLDALKRHVWMTMSEHLHVMLGPTFGGHGSGLHIFFNLGPESPIGNLMFAFAIIGSGAILLRRQWALWPLLALVVVYSLYYVFLVPIVFGWYKVPYILTLLLLSARGVQAVVSLLDPAMQRRAQLGFACAYIGLFIAILPITFLTERQIQHYVENDVRKPAGLYLAEHMAEDEAVGCEPLGYMSYYSRGNVYDWPGLASRTVVTWSKEHPGGDLETMLQGLQPEYLFLRDMEILFRFQDPAWFHDHYHVVETFLIDPEAAKQIRWIDRNIDTRFRIYKRNRPDDERPYDESLWPTIETYYEN